MANERLKAALSERGMTAEQFAAAVNEHSRDRLHQELRCGDRLVRKWLSGAVVRPQLRHELAIEGVLGCAVEDVGLLSRRRPSRSEAAASNRGKRVPVDRRDFLVDSPVALVALGAPDVCSPPDGHLLAARLREVTRTLRASGDLVGGGALYEAAIRQLQLAQAGMRGARWPAAAERAVLAASGELAALAGWFAFDTRRYPAAERLYDRALRLGRVAGSTSVEVSAFASMSMLARADERYSEAVAVADCGRRAARDLDDRHLVALLHVRCALGWSRLRDQRMSDMHMHDAWSAFGEAQGEPAGWMSFFDVTELRSLTAAVHADLGRYAHAVRHAEQALLGYEDTFARNRAYCLARLAGYYLRMREPEQASHIASALLAMTPQVTSAYVRHLLREVRDEARPYASVPAARDFLERFEAVGSGGKDERAL